MKERERKKREMNRKKTGAYYCKYFLIKKTKLNMAYHFACIAH